MVSHQYHPPFWLKNGLSITLYSALWGRQSWEQTLDLGGANLKPSYEEVVMMGAGNVPLFVWLATPPQPRGTIVATYGITGDLSNQWFLQLLGRKAFAQNYALVLFDSRAHGKTATLSRTLSSDGLYDGEDFVRLAAEAKARGFPAPFWFAGFSLGGQLALWGAKAVQDAELLATVGLQPEEIGGVAAICPNLDANRSLTYLEQHPLGCYIERAIAASLEQLVQEIDAAHPGWLDPQTVARAKTIRGFDQELVIGRLGFDRVEDYYDATSPLPFLPHLTVPTLILYAADDPMFDPSLVPDLQAACADNPAIALHLTRYGGHVGYLSSKSCQQQWGDGDLWWAWNRVLEWMAVEGER